MTLLQSSSILWEDEYLFDTHELNDNVLGKPIELIPDDPFESFFNTDDVYFHGMHSDIESATSIGSISTSDEGSIISDIYDKKDKYEIRYHDCMWSGNCDLNKDGQYRCGYHHISNKQLTPKTTNNNNNNCSSNSNNSNNNSSSSGSSNKTSQNIQNMPPGASLLINSRSNLQKKQEKLKIPNLLTSDFLKERETMPRPDTPVSLDDDPPEFKHSVDLSACVMGSNNICLDADKMIINKLKEQLEDTTTQKLDIKNIIPGNKKRTLSEVLNVIGTVENDSSLCADSDSSDSESTTSSVIYKNSSSSQPSSNFYQSVLHSDHSYTRSKAGVDVVGLETPSDSDEEIDVVSIGDKKLPTNPSDKDRRVIQNKVAHRISTRIVKTPGGIRTIPPRRRGSLDPPYYPSSIGNHHIKSNPSSKQTSPPSTPYSTSSGYSSINSVSKYGGSTTTTATNAGRKRCAGTIINGRDDYVPPSSKRYRNKNKRSSVSKKNFDIDEADTIEKRNLHNDMERQRRIGLKNLFEALKKQIPSIMDKERAPKVNILREAAKLCGTLTKDDDELSVKKRQLQNQLHRLQAQLKSSRILE